jgi:glycosyltransferase involved in cell wall biosynthesis
MHVIGRNPGNLQVLAQDDRSFHVHGFVDDIRPHVERAGVYVCPIFDGGGTKLKVLDAFSMGKAVVAYAPAVEGLDVVDGVHALVADDAHSFAQLVLRLMHDSDLRTDIGRAARRLAQARYSFDRIATRMSTAYGELVEQQQQ